MNQLLLPTMTTLEKRQFSEENHRPTKSDRFVNNKITRTTNGNKTNHKHNKKPSKSKSKSKTKPIIPQIEKYSVEWIREKAQHIAMMKLQV